MVSVRKTPGLALVAFVLCGAARVPAHGRPRRGCEAAAEGKKN
ncbi:MAG TPA: hypothetical protein VF621_21150 [Pyrinomonadaceae bacterium]